MARIKKHKKRHTSRPLPPHSPPISVSTDDDEDEDEDEEVANYQQQLESSGFLMNEFSDPVHREVIDDCEFALSFLSRRRPQWAKADRFVKELRGDHDSFAIFHHVCAQVHYICADNATDQEAKKQRFKDAISSARRATLLSPSNVEYSLFYVKILLRNPDSEFEEAVTECKRALAVPYPICFLVERSGKWDGTAKAEIASYQENLQSILDGLEPSYRIGVKVQEFEEHCCLLGKEEFVSEALNFAKENHTWRFWACPGCDKKFGDSKLHWEHVSKEHVGILSEELKFLFPKEVNQARVETLKESMHCDPNDERRTQLLRLIDALIRMLGEYMYLTDSHLDYVQILAPGLCLEVLDILQLQKVHRFVHLMAIACKLLRITKKTAFDNEFPRIPETEVVVEKIFVDHVSAKLIIDPPRFPIRSPPLVRAWLNEGPSWDGSWVAWTDRTKLRETQGDKILKLLQQEFTDLNTLCAKKRDLIIRRDALELLNEVCEKEPAENELSGVDDLTKVISEIREEEETIKKLQDSVAWEICKVDAQIRYCQAKTRRLKLKLRVNCDADYHSVLVPFLKSCLEKDFGARE